MIANYISYGVLNLYRLIVTDWEGGEEGEEGAVSHKHSTNSMETKISVLLEPTRPLFVFFAVVLAG